MERLMKVADQVKEELQRDDALFGIGRRAGEFRRELLDLVDDAILSRPIRGDGASRNRPMTKVGSVKIGMADLDIDEMPLTGLRPRPVPICIAEFVGSGWLAGDVVRGQRVGVGREQPGHFRAHVGVKKRLRHQRDDFVALVAPGKRRRGYKVPNAIASAAAAMGDIRMEVPCSLLRVAPPPL
jgi:hypothetical protein